MERMPYADGVDTVVTRPARVSPIASSDWRAMLPTLSAGQVVLRELRASDAPSLFALLTTSEVARFISPPPNSVEAFERFIAWTLDRRAAGEYACFAVTLKGFDTAIGIFQIRQLDGEFTNAEWGFAIGSAFWGTGVFQTAAEQVLDFAFATLGVARLEARAAVLNGRGNGALMKVGAVPEAVLRRSFYRNGEYLDQVLYSIVAGDRGRPRPSSVRVEPCSGTTSVH
jgi:RimJ/RimL family protein N-acetyltransferase